MANYAVDFNYLIEDLDLNDEWFLTRGTLWRPAVSTRRTSVQLPGVHGVLPVGKMTYESPSLLLNHTVSAPTAALAEEKTQALIGLLSTKSSAGSDQVRITRIAGGYETEALARLVAISSPEEFVPQAWIVSFGSEFEITSVFFRDIEYVTTYDEDVVASQNQNIYWAGGDGSTAPITDAILRFKGPLSEVNVTDSKSGTGFTIQKTVTGSEYLYVDTGGWDAWVSTGTEDWTLTGTNVSGLLDALAYGMLELTPEVAAGDPYARTISMDCYFVGHTPGTTKVAVKAKRAYL